jgi:hypothetical protein
MRGASTMFQFVTSGTGNGGKKKWIAESLFLFVFGLQNSNFQTQLKFLYEKFRPKNCKSSRPG